RRVLFPLHPHDRHRAFAHRNVWCPRHKAKVPLRMVGQGAQHDCGKSAARDAPLPALRALIPGFMDIDPSGVIAGLDPAIHHLGIEVVFAMDARVKPAHDESGFVKLGITVTGTVVSSSPGSWRATDGRR